MSEPPPPIRTLRSGRYLIIGVLGAGSQAETLDAVDKLDGRAVAFKRFQVRGAKSWKDVELAEREARVLSTLSHPNLPVYVEHFEEDGALCLVMEKIDGETLASLRRRKASLSSSDIERFLSDAAVVLGYLHSRVPPIIHRDIKPGNVIRRADGSFAFVDFGSVRDQLKPEGGSTVVGTFGYMAPEQFQGRALPGSDVYAVAATALALATGCEPEDLPHRGLGIDVPAALGKGAEPWLVRALSAMLEPDPDKRPARVSVQHPSADPGEARRASRRERRERARAERSSSDRESNAWQSSDPWNLNEMHAQHLEQRQRMKAEGRRIRREVKAQVREQTRRIKREAHAWQRNQRYGARPHQHGWGPVAPVLVSLLLLGLLAARVATFALFRVFLPTLLSFLGIFLAGPRRAASRLRDVGEQGDRGLRHAIAAVRARILGAQEHDHSIDVEAEEIADQREPDGETAARTRVSDSRIRVQTTTAQTDELSDSEDDPDARRHRR